MAKSKKKSEDFEDEDEYEREPRMKKQDGWFRPWHPAVLSFYALILLMAICLGLLVNHTGVWVVALSVYMITVLLTEVVMRYNRYEVASRRRIRELEAEAAAAEALLHAPPLSAKNDPRLTDEPVPPPPEEEFWAIYNRRLELPLSSVGTILVHVLIGTILVFILLGMANDSDQSDVTVKMMDVAGMDDFGEGSKGSGGTDDPLVKANEDEGKKSLDEMLSDPTLLPEVRDELKKTVKFIDPSGNMPMTAANVEAINNLTDTLKKKLLGGRQGNGGGAGQGFDGSEGAGPGGTGANSTLGRNMRWTLRFNVTSGRDYLSQLKAMDAKLLIPMPNKDTVILIADIGSPETRKVINENDLGPYAGLLKFADSRAAAVSSVAGALGLEFPPKTFFAVFTKQMENELAEKEKNYRNRKPEDIEETVFKVTIRGGTPELIVDEQKAKSR